MKIRWTWNSKSTWKEHTMTSKRNAKLMNATIGWVHLHLEFIELHVPQSCEVGRLEKIYTKGYTTCFWIPIHKNGILNVYKFHNTTFESSIWIMRAFARGSHESTWSDLFVIVNLKKHSSILRRLVKLYRAWIRIFKALIKYKVQVWYRGRNFI